MFKYGPKENKGAPTIFVIFRFDELDVDGLHGSTHGSDQAACHQEAETKLHALGYLQAPEHKDWIDSENDVGQSGPTYVNNSLVSCVW